jgi:hypothetical protein
MLEGQVAALTPGLLSAVRAGRPARRAVRERCIGPISARSCSNPRRPAVVPRQERDPAEHVERNPLLTELLAEGDRSVVVVDVDGVHRFAPGLVTEDALHACSIGCRTSERWAISSTSTDRRRSTRTRRCSAHRAYLGRSGSMYAYEGIGSVYWHMVTKLLLACRRRRRPPPNRRRPGRRRPARGCVPAGAGRARVQEVRSEFGAIPIDPYSHTPAHAGAQQPGMTGAVKEEILTRPRELGVRVAGGRVVFDALLLDRSRAARAVDLVVGQNGRWPGRDDRAGRRFARAHRVRDPGGGHRGVGSAVRRARPRRRRDRPVPRALGSSGPRAPRSSGGQVRSPASGLASASIDEGPIDACTYPCRTLVRGISIAHRSGAVPGQPISTAPWRPGSPPGAGHRFVVRCSVSGLGRWRRRWCCEWGRR